MTTVRVNVMKIYSMCNTNDLTWGNRPSIDLDTLEIKRKEFS
jgi:hypothetical protein